MRTLTPVVLTGLIVLSACEGDKGVKAYNNDPTAAITSHTSGIEVLEGYVLSMRGSVSDADDSASTLTATWYMDETEMCATAAPADDGTTSCEIVPTVGAEQISLEVRDPQGAAGSAWIGITVVQTEAPVALITSPQLGDKLYVDQKVTFEGTVSDGEDPADSLIASWSSDLDGALSVTAEPTSDGSVLGFGNLSEGEHALTLTVEGIYS